MNLIAGSVTPFGLLNDKEWRVQFYIDKDFMNEPHLIEYTQMIIQQQYG